MVSETAMDKVSTFLAQRYFVDDSEKVRFSCEINLLFPYLNNSLCLCPNWTVITGSKWDIYIYIYYKPVLINIYLCWGCRWIAIACASLSQSVSVICIPIPMERVTESKAWPACILWDLMTLLNCCITGLVRKHDNFLKVFWRKRIITEPAISGSSRKPQSTNTVQSCASPYCPWRDNVETFVSDYIRNVKEINFIVILLKRHKCPAVEDKQLFFFRIISFSFSWIYVTLLVFMHNVLCNFIHLLLKWRLNDKWCASIVSAVISGCQRVATGWHTVSLWG